MVINITKEANMFDMSINQNFATFPHDKGMIIVESFDNQTFEVRYGTAEQSQKIAKFSATNSQELNTKLEDAVKNK